MAPKRTVDPFSVVRRASKMADHVLVGISGGKDSACALDLAWTHFKRVTAYHLYTVPGLPSKIRYLNYVRSRYPGIEILEAPHWTVSSMVRFGNFRTRDRDMKIIKANDMDLWLRQQAGTRWIVGGEKIADSLMRRGMISKHGKIDLIRGRFYVLADWTKAHVMNYLRRENIRLSDECYYLGESLRFKPQTLALVAQHDPEDFAVICKHYPFARTVVAQAKFAAAAKSSNAPTFASGEAP